MVQRLLLVWVLASVPATAIIAVALRSAARAAERAPRLAPVVVSRPSVAIREERRAG